MHIAHDTHGRKSRVAALSVASNTFLVLSKLGVGIAAGSVSVISEAIHSGIDLIAALIAFVAVRAASRPADREHPFGHGKFENVSGTLEAALIFLAAILIIKEAIEKLTHPPEVQMLGLGMGVMAVSALVNTFVATKLMRVARDTDSVALEADALHLKTDVYTSLGVFAGLLLMHLTGLPILDPLVAIGVALLIIKEAWELTRRSIGGLLDSSLNLDEIESIREIIASHGPSVVNFHNLRTRKAGSERQIDLHVKVSSKLTIAQAHNICDSIELGIAQRLPGARTLIHVEPCDGQCDACDEACAARTPPSGTC